MQTVQKLGEGRQWFPLNRFCIQKRIKISWQKKPDDTKHRVVKKIQGVPLLFCCCLLLFICYFNREGPTDLMWSSYWVPLGETGTLKRHRATRRADRYRKRVPESGNVEREES